MNGDDLKSRVQSLRAAGSTPKQIARTLGIPRAKAVSLIHSGRRPEPDRTTSGPRTRALPEKPLVGCWISRQWSNGLSIDQRPADWTDDADQPPLAMGAGLVSIVVAREQGPHDNPARILRILNQSAAPYTYTVESDL